MLELTEANTDQKESTAEKLFQLKSSVKMSTASEDVDEDCNLSSKKMDELIEDVQLEMESQMLIFERPRK
jgi:hypothetical protein